MFCHTSITTFHRLFQVEAVSKSDNLFLEMSESISSKSFKFLYYLKMNSNFYLYLSIFLNILSNRFTISFSISFKYYFFIHYYYYFFLTTKHFPTFFYSTPDYYNRKKIWRINNSPSNLISYCSWVKKIFGYRESIGVVFFLVSFSIIENILLLHRPLEMLLHIL